MRFFVLFLAATLYAANPQLAGVKTVYLLPMLSGFDQYLANQLQKSGLYLVTTDANSADAVFTDSLGPEFERKIEELFPAAPPPPDPAEKDKDKKDTEKKDGAEQSTGNSLTKNTAEPPPISTFRRGRGNFFLVERGKRQVVWSTFEKPRNSLPQELDKAAKRVVEKLKKDLAAK